MELELSTYPSMSTKAVIPMLRLSLSKAIGGADRKKWPSKPKAVVFMARVGLLLDYQWESTELQVRVTFNGKFVMNINPYDDEQVRGFLTWAVIEYMEGNT